MVANENEFKGVRIGSYTNETEKLAKDLRKYLKSDFIIFCVGTDRCTGDSLAPMIGTLLEEKGYKNVMGTLKNPVHAQNISEKIKEIPKDKIVLAIDACLGKTENIGNVYFNSGALLAGRGVNKKLPPVGDFHISGIVNISSADACMASLLLQNTRLSLVYELAKQCVNAIELAFPLEANVENNDRESNII